MSSQEHLFIRSDLPIEQVATQIAVLLGMKVFTSSNGGLFLSRRARTDPDKEVGGEISVNYLADDSSDESEQSLLDAYNVLWDFAYTGRDEDVQLREARLAFDELVSAARWPLVLVSGLDLLIAAWDPSLGLRQFPAATSPDAPHRRVWSPYRSSGA